MEYRADTIEYNNEINEIINNYQCEYVSGQWYIAQTGLNKIMKILKGDYKTLTKKQREVFRSDCIDTAQGFWRIHSWSYYINQCL